MPRPEIGTYMVIEGMDGSGKTTQRDLLAEYIKNKGVDVVTISEPGGTGIGDEIRQILKNGSLKRTPESNLDLFMIARRELIAQKIKPLNAGGVSIVSDRNWFSSMAYQGYGEKMGPERIKRKAEDVIGDLRYIIPSSVIIDIPVNVAIDRMLSRGGSEADYFESKGKDFFDRVANGYRWVSRIYNIPLIDGEQSIEDVHTDIVRHLGELAVAPFRL